MKRRGRKDVGVGRRSGTRCSRPLSGTWGVREVSATRDSDCSAEADGSLMFPDFTSILRKKDNFSAANKKTRENREVRRAV